MDERIQEQEFLQQKQSLEKKKPFSFKWKKDNFLILILMGVLLLVIAWPVSKSDKTNAEKMMGQKETKEAVESYGEESPMSMMAVSKTKEDMLSYGAYLEKELETLLSSMEGAGKVMVMVTLKDGGEAVMEKDMITLREGTTEVDSAGGSRNTTHISNQEETIFSEGGSSGQIPYVKRINAPEVLGVLVAAEGGENLKVVKNITEAIQALFDIEAHKIKVVKMNAR